MNANKQILSELNEIKDKVVRMERILKLPKSIPLIRTRTTLSLSSSTYGETKIRLPNIPEILVKKIEVITSLGNIFQSDGDIWQFHIANKSFSSIKGLDNPDIWHYEGKQLERILDTEGVSSHFNTGNLYKNDFKDGILVKPEQISHFAGYMDNIAGTMVLLIYWKEVVPYKSLLQQYL
ncbi:MAG: hypothetical protein GF329_15145 [Candidatus Lokiarchaeota archaeon]|nr:hypothetical protein [Candidatus Lokiarchaeota archaeon]